MNMFVPRIWGFDLGSTQAQVARQAGWSRADILWEGLMEAANNAWVKGDPKAAAKGFRRAFWLGRLSFARSDLRHATVRLNLGILALKAGKGATAKCHFKKAALHWDTHAEANIAAMTIAPRARSSLFHLRMEALHRNTYHDNFRTRVGKIAGEIRSAIDNLQRDDAAGCRLYARWRGERPNVYDDTRKVLGACLLILDP
jgi:hypothetical protein